MRNLIKKLVPKPLKALYITLRKRLITLQFHMFRIFPIRKKRVVLCNVWGFGDNPKWIAKALRRADKSVEVVFVTEKTAAEHVPKGVKLVQTNSPRAIYYLATAHVWVDCNRKEPYIVKRSGQIYIQTWHGSLPLKKLEADYPGLTEQYMENAARDSKMTDLCLSNGEFMNDIYRKAFGYECDCMVTGSARLDPLIRPNAKRVIRTKNRIAEIVRLKAKKNGIADGIADILNVSDKSGAEIVSGTESAENSDDIRSINQESFTRINNTVAGSIAAKDSIAADNISVNKNIALGNAERMKIAVYAPTYRENGEQEEFPDLEAVRSKLEERFGGEFVMVARVHPLVRRALKDYGSRIVDGSSFGDLYELLEASDVLITDYSNTLFEFAFAGKPVFLYATDVAEYEENRGFYFDYSRLPYPHAATSGELCDEIENYSAFDYRREQKEFFENIGIIEDGKASRRIAELILRKVYRE